MKIDKTFENFVQKGPTIIETDKKKTLFDKIDQSKAPESSIQYVPHIDDSSRHLLKSNVKLSQ